MTQGGPAPHRRRRQARRARREATDGIPEDQREVLSAESASDPGPDGRPETSDGSSSDEWWQQQRPPHWS